MALDADMIAGSGQPVVVGLGPTGVSVARFLAQRGEQFVVVDSRQNPPGLAQLRHELPHIEVITGELPQALLAQAAQLYVSPGIALQEPAVAAAVEAGVPVAGDIDLFAAAAQAPLVGITGSNAKSTVTELLGLMARRSDLQVGVGGNLGTPALELLDDSNECYILELSSFQLERAGELGLAVACILNVSEDHLDRHGDIDSYHRAKQRIFGGCATAVFNREDARTAVPEILSAVSMSFGLSAPTQREFGIVEHGGAEWLAYEDSLLMPVHELGMVGRHNIANALAALALGTAMQLPLAPMLAALREFTGLPHRCELVGDSAGVRFINDSKATNTGATLAALQGLSEGCNIVLIAGGEGKGADFHELGAAFASSCKGVVLIGEDAAQIEAVIPNSVTALHATSMAAAVSAARQLAAAGDVVLLSPACASFDMFRSFVDRGEQFTRAVRALICEEQADG
ncbi:UDP-N-acetylmuramoyl-L-alanine--D-glutamate ligase [Candidatus Litorirhabdus singularis]